MGTQINVNGLSIRVDARARVIILNTETIPFAPGMTGKSITISNNEITLDGYVYRSGKWEKIRYNEWTF